MYYDLIRNFVVIQFWALDLSFFGRMKQIVLFRYELRIIGVIEHYSRPEQSRLIDL